jgi:hypothetical protein
VWIGDHSFGYGAGARLGLQNKALYQKARLMRNCKDSGVEKVLLVVGTALEISQSACQILDGAQKARAEKSGRSAEPFPVKFD